MVWQYEEYADYPVILDWTRGKPRFEVEIREDIENIEVDEPNIPGTRPTLYLITGNGILRPTFYLFGEESARPYQIRLDKLKGMERVLQSTIHQGSLGGFQVFNLKRRKMKAPDFDDFKTMAQYAAERLPRIAHDVILQAEDFPEDIPQNELNRILEYRDKMLSVIDWEGSQKETCNEFYRDFMVNVYGILTPGKIVPRGFTKEQIDELERIVHPLNSRQ